MAARLKPPRVRSKLPGSLGGRLTQTAIHLTAPANMSSSSPRTAALYLRPLLRLLDDRGLDADAMLARYGLQRGELMSADLRVDVAVTSALLEEARLLTSDPAIGLTLVRYTEYATFGPLGVALAAGGSLRAVLARITRYHAIVSDAVESRFEERPGALLVEFAPRAGAAPHPQSILFVMACVGGLVRLRLSQRLNPILVVLRDVDDACLAAASRFFGSAVERGDCCRIEYPSAAASAMLDGSDPEMAAMLEATLKARLAQAGRPWSVELALWLEARLPEGEPTLAEAARALGTSERSLQRRLGAEQRSWRQLIDDTRRALVERHLHAPGMSLTELSFLLGFADASSLSRAFRKWYGVSATEYKKRE